MADTRTQQEKDALLALYESQDVARHAAAHARYREYLKENALALADEHKKTCDDPECVIALVGIADLLRLAGFELSPDDIRRLV